LNLLNVFSFHFLSNLILLQIVGAEGARLLWE